MAYGPVRLLLVDYDELRVLWDALSVRKQLIEFASDEWEQVVAMQERVGELLASSFGMLDR
jgi:hypothetical protein